MIVALIVITTIAVFIVVDIALRLLLERLREARTQKVRAAALNQDLNLHASDETPSLKRVELPDPRARVLAVDDEPVILDVFRKTLVLAGFSVDTVETGPEALGLIHQHDYDFLFTDLKMPEMDGVEVTKAVKHLRPDIDVIVITGYGTIESAVETVKSGALEYIQKPFTEDELVGMVNSALIRRQDRLNKQKRHRVRLIKPGVSESKFELNVPAGVFISPQHAWAKIELDGTVMVGLDDFIRKLFDRTDRVELPRTGMKIDGGDKLFALGYGDYSLDIPSPVSGTVTSVNTEHVEHPEWLAIKPFELSWMCGIEPTNLAAELPALMIGLESVDWYQKEVDRYSLLLQQLKEASADRSSGTSEPDESQEHSDAVRLLAGFSEPFLQH